MRQLIEMAISYGRKLKSTQTGYLHYCYDAHEGDVHLSIPTVENIYYVLALFRSRTVENVTEAKVMLDALLRFQDNVSGNFPIYLHEFPVCKDRFIGVHVAAALFWILKSFHQILGNDLRCRVEIALLAAVHHVLKNHREKAAPYTVAIKIASVAVGVGRLLGYPSLEAEGNVLLEALRAHPDEICWYSPESLGEILSALAIAYSSIKESVWGDFWRHLERTWYQKTACYVGPSVREWQLGSEPQLTLYDLFLGYLSGEFSARMMKGAPVHLEAVLIPAMDDLFSIAQDRVYVEGNIGGGHWGLYKGDLFAYSFVGKLEVNPIHAKGFSPLRFVWGDLAHVHSLVFHGGAGASVNVMRGSDDKKMKIIFDLEGSLEFEDREKCREVACFFDAHDDIKFSVEEEKSSTFTLGEKLLIRSGSLTFLLTLELVEGEGRFLGHRMLGNRSAQKGAKGNARFEAFDWLVFLRTIQREATCRIVAELELR